MFQWCKNLITIVLFTKPSLTNIVNNLSKIQILNIFVNKIS